MSVATAVDCWACGKPAGASDEYRVPGLFRCANCGLLFQPERPAEELHGLYDDAYHQEILHAAEEDTQRRYEARARVAILRAALPPPARVLEVGSASGHFLAAAREAGYDVLGLEPAPDTASSARERFGVEVINGVLESAALPERGFGAAAAWHVLEHLREPRAALERIRTTLQPGGALLLELPNIASAAAAREGSSWRSLELLHHVAHYTPQALRSVLERSGYTAQSLHTVPHAVYHRRPLHPRTIGFKLLRELPRTRALPWGRHRSRHELLRAVARA